MAGSLFHGDFDAASNLVSSDPSFNNVRDLGLEQYLSSSPNRVVASTPSVSPTIDSFDDFLSYFEE